jgi:peptidoglycan-associated lipoprotein
VIVPSVPFLEVPFAAGHGQILDIQEKEVLMKKLGVTILILLVALFAFGCPKKDIMKQDPSSKTAADLAAERERAARLEAERKEKAAAEARIKEQKAEAEAKARTEAEAAERAKREADKTLVAQKTPGVPGTIYESGLLKDVYFDFDSYEVGAADAEILKQNAAVILKNPSWKIQIEGHCDERGTAEYNLALGERRANSVKKYLVTLGIPQARISTISYGEERPFDRGHTEEAWSKNRRAHIIVLSK